MKNSSKVLKFIGAVVLGFCIGSIATDVVKYLKDDSLDDEDDDEDDDDEMFVEDLFEDE